MSKEVAKRYNKGKLRYELIPDSLKYVAEVYTKGAHKYSVYEDDKGNKILGMNIPIEEVYKYKLIDDASDNWRKGRSWKEMMGSIDRHIALWKAKEDIDSELGTFHLANAAWGMLSLLEFYKIAPQFDDRVSKPNFKIGLDIDGVLADFIGHLMRISGNEGHMPKHWNDPIIRREYEKVKKDKDFWKNIPALLNKEEIPFEVHCYITARSIDDDVTKAWLDINGFPEAPVYSVGHGESKIEIAKKSGIDLFVDDCFSNFVELNEAGICTYLYDTPYNQKYDVGYRRIKSLKELPV